jgi:diguanylate cyclase (GGDEF)-like protein
MADMGWHRGTRHTFRPVRRPLEPDVILTDERLRIDRNVFWFGAAALYGLGGLLLLVAVVVDQFVSQSQLPADLTSPLTISMAFVAIGLSGFWLFMARREMPALPWMDVIVGVGTLLIAVVAIGAQDYGPDMLSYFLLTAMTAAFFMPFKQAIWHLLAISVVELYVAFNSANVPNGKIISLNILFFTMMTAAMLMVARKRIQDGILHNVALAGRDPLTGVANLRKFNERLQTEIDRADRSGEPLTLLMIDLDDFKDVNDKYSYTLGDAVLVASARAMSRVVRSNELLARRGGDEFAVIAVGADSESAEALSKRIKHAVRRERLKLCPDVSPEASVGIADWRIGESAVELLRRADSSLHVSKIIAHTEEPYSDM